jgi:hypothetical protein
MILSSGTLKWISEAWGVLVLFLIPVGGGIPAGVLLAKTRGLEWPTMTILYFISDIILACLFEPLMRLIIFAGKHIQFLARLSEAFRKSSNKTISRYGVSPGPFSLIMVSFGIDPMTGRTAAMAAGHSFLSGWAIAITGDMIFFAIIIISTLALNNVLGDGTWTAVIIMVAMIAIPSGIRRVRQYRARPSA